MCCFLNPPPPLGAPAGQSAGVVPQATARILVIKGHTTNSEGYFWANVPYVLVDDGNM